MDEEEGLSGHRLSIVLSWRSVSRSPQSAWQMGAGFCSLCFLISYFIEHSEINTFLYLTEMLLIITHTSLAQICWHW